jgi:HEAT repeat protein
MVNWMRSISATSDRKLQKYLSDPFTYENQILKLGERAVPGLISILDDERNGWGAASILGRLGIRDSAILDELRQRVMGGSGVSNASAIALAHLGDLEFLTSVVEDKAKQLDAVRGILILLKEPSRAPLEYAPLERLLALGSKEITAIIQDELKPGSSVIEIKPTDSDEALRGLRSEQGIIRLHAVQVLGNRKLGMEASKTVLPALAERLEDENADVRRLTLLSLSQWKSAAKPYHDAMRKLKNDSDGLVRSTATYVFE